jgi:CIC family chloride channel protein
MPSEHRLKERASALLDLVRIRLSGQEDVVILAALGLLTGLLAGAAIHAFRYLVETTQSSFLPGGGTENYEGLAPAIRFTLCAGGGLAVGLLLQAVGSAARQVGVVHVMERLAYHQGHLPLANAVMQFLGAALSIVAGHSVGREGPGVHLGAVAGGQLAVRLGLPNNTVRTLVACGVAASIGAYFNTPLAGVIFAMEVVMMEYTLQSFAPVILAAVSATTLTRVVHGDFPAFAVPPLEIKSLGELWLVLGLGLLMGLLAATFSRLVVFVTGLLNAWPIWLRCTLGGTVVGLVGVAVPEVMGIGYDTVNAALLGEIGLALLGTIALAKLLATAIGLGMGLPGGLIGPTLVIGALAGGAMGAALAIWLPGATSEVGFYAMIGMGAMMAATLQAPLAALTALLELTANPNIILPGMLALITAGLSARRLYRTESVFLLLMRARGLDYRNDPVAQHLRRVAVSAAMQRSVVLLPREVGREAARQSLADQPRWILVRDGVLPVALLAAADLARWLEESPGEPSVDLLAIPADRREVGPVPLEATLQEARDVLRQRRLQVLYVTRPAAPGIPRIYGILTADDIERSYQQ